MGYRLRYLCCARDEGSDKNYEEIRVHTTITQQCERKQAHDEYTAIVPFTALEKDALSDERESVSEPDLDDETRPVPHTPRSPRKLQRRRRSSVRTSDGETDAQKSPRRPSLPRLRKKRNPSSETLRKQETSAEVQRRESYSQNLMSVQDAAERQALEQRERDRRKLWEDVHGGVSVTS